MATWISRTDGSSVYSRRESDDLAAPLRWTEATRPTVGLFDGYSGYNTDFKSIEVYDKTAAKWRVVNGTWTVTTRPSTTLLAVGSMGCNTTEGMGGLESWDGTDWRSAS